jgi:hypothetical protein
MYVNNIHGINLIRLWVTELNLMNKDDRILLFQKVLYNNG